MFCGSLVMRLWVPGDEKGWRSLLQKVSGMKPWIVYWTEKMYPQTGGAIHASGKVFLSSNTPQQTIWKQPWWRRAWKGVNGNNVFILNNINPQLASHGPWPPPAQSLFKSFASVMETFFESLDFISCFGDNAAKRHCPSIFLTVPNLNTRLKSSTVLLMDHWPSYTVELREIPLLPSEPLQKTYIQTNFRFYQLTEQHTFNF